MKEASTFILLLVGILLLSCSERNDLMDLPTAIESGGKKSVSLTVGGNTVDKLTASIENFGIYAYVQDTLVSSTSGTFSDETEWNVELPLDESVTLFAYANSNQVVYTDSLSTAQILLDEQGKSEVFTSELVGVISDNSVDSVHFELNRIVGQMAFEPIEDEAMLEVITQFDAIDVLFINVGTAFLPGTNTSIQDTITIRTTKTEGFKASVYSFPTFSGNFGTLEVIYYKEGQVVNKTIRALDVAINVEPSKRSVVYMPLLDEDYLESSFPMTTASFTKSAIASGIIVKEYQF